MLATALNVGGGDGEADGRREEDDGAVQDVGSRRYAPPSLPIVSQIQERAERPAYVNDGGNLRVTFLFPSRRLPAEEST